MNLLISVSQMIKSFVFNHLSSNNKLRTKFINVRIITLDRTVKSEFLEHLLHT